MLSRIMNGGKMKRKKIMTRKTTPREYKREEMSTGERSVRHFLVSFDIASRRLLPTVHNFHPPRVSSRQSYGWKLWPAARRQENRREVSQESILLSHAWSGSLLLSMALTFVRRRFHGKESSPLEAIRELG